MENDLIEALQQAANGQYPTTIRHLQPLLSKLGWTLPELANAVDELESQGIVEAQYANNQLKSIALSSDFPNLI